MAESWRSRADQLETYANKSQGFPQDQADARAAALDWRIEADALEAAGSIEQYNLNRMGQEEKL